MAFLIGGANSAADTGFSVANSCRFNSFDTPQMHKTPGSAGNLDNWTFSVWIKRANISAAGNNSYKTIFGLYNTADNQEGLHIQNDDVMYFQFWQGGAKVGEIKTNRKFRDVGAWYHIVIAYDSTNGTAGDRMKMYVNGVRETSFSTTTDPTSGLNSQMGGTDKLQLGCINTTNHFDGYMSEVVYINGSTLDPTSFGEFDEDSPNIWKPKDVSGLTFGTNGFYLDFKDSSNLGNDKSGGTDFTEVNLAAADQAVDTPTNNFCTLNSLIKWYVAGTLSEGNCKFVGGSGWSGSKGTMAVSTGKWYWEVKLSAGTLANNFAGVQEINVTSGDVDPQELTGSTVFYNNDGGEIFKDGTGTTADYGLLDSGDILGVALDMDAGSYGQITFYDQNSAIVSDYDLSTSSDYVMPFFSNHSSTVEVNFGGCSAFALSSAAADGNGYGNFEFAPPSGYLALCTKNLATDG